MNEILFVQKREPDWQRLHILTAKADVSPTQLTPEEIKEYVKLYKRVSGDLALARTKSTNLELTEFLNDLCGRAYGVMYRPKNRGVGQAIANGVATVAITFRKRFRFVLASFLIFLVSIIFSYVCLEVKPETRAYFVPPQFESSFDAWKSGKFDERTLGESIQMSGMYASNNPAASLAAGSIAAVSFGVGTVMMMYQNGAIMGALIHEVAPTGHVSHVFIGIAPHGVTELSGIFVAGGAGLLMGWTLLFPGRRKRGEALLAAGKDSIILLTTGVLMMYIAAPIEGFFSFNPNIGNVYKILFAFAAATGWFFFWYGYARDQESIEDTQAQSLAAYY